jgi:hypothetical protein
MLVDHVIDHNTCTVIKIGDEVETDDVRFFVGSINDSQQLCFIDTSKPWQLLNDRCPMAACIRGGQYGVTAIKLRKVNAE